MSEFSRPLGGGGLRRTLLIFKCKWVWVWGFLDWNYLDSFKIVLKPPHCIYLLSHFFHRHLNSNSLYSLDDEAFHSLKNLKILYVNIFLKILYIFSFSFLFELFITITTNSKLTLSSKVFLNHIHYIGLFQIFCIFSARNINAKLQGLGLK